MAGESLIIIDKNLRLTSCFRKTFEQWFFHVEIMSDASCYDSNISFDGLSESDLLVEILECLVMFGTDDDT